LTSPCRVADVAGGAVVEPPVVESPQLTAPAKRAATIEVRHVRGMRCI